MNREICLFWLLFFLDGKNNHISNVNNKILNPEVSAIRGKGYIEAIINTLIGEIALK